VSALETINETLEKLVADRAVAESQLSDALAEQRRVEHALAVARDKHKRATFAHHQAKNKHAELLNHLVSRKDTPQPLWDKLTDLGKEIVRSEALTVPASDELYQREKELKAAIDAVAFAEMTFRQATERVTQVAEELQHAKREPE
jgi:chromosome segregation ATPase